MRSNNFSNEEELPLNIASHRSKSSSALIFGLVILYIAASRFIKVSVISRQHNDNILYHDDYLRRSPFAGHQANNEKLCRVISVQFIIAYNALLNGLGICTEKMSCQTRRCFCARFIKILQLVRASFEIWTNHFQSLGFKYAVAKELASDDVLSSFQTWTINKVCVFDTCDCPTAAGT